MCNRRDLRAALSAAAMLLNAGAPLAETATAPGLACCADLEARVAELEATVARKGYRTVTLEVAGLINQGVLGWDDGAESNAYVVTNDNARSRLRFIGSADITSDWQAGYRIEMGVDKLDIRDSVWFFKSKRNGTLFVGTTFPSFTHIADANVTQTNWFAEYGGVENTGLNMFLRSARNGGLSRTLTWRRIRPTS